VQYLTLDLALQGLTYSIPFQAKDEWFDDNPILQEEIAYRPMPGEAMDWGKWHRANKAINFLDQNTATGHKLTYFVYSSQAQFIYNSIG
jgi:hypothetical protein